MEPVVLLAVGILLALTILLIAACGGFKEEL